MAVETATGSALLDCLGADAARLPDVVRDAHIGTIRLVGRVIVERGRGLGRVVAALMRLPPSNPHSRMTVVGTHLSDRMIWERDFDGRKFHSVFRKDGVHLVETVGRIALRLRPFVERGRLHYKVLGATLAGIPLPKLMTPLAVAWEGERDGHYDFEVEMRLPLIGRIVRYRGLLTLEPISV